MAMRMREPLHAFEEAFAEEVELERSRRQRLRRTAAQRSRKRTIVRAQKRSSMRFAMLVLTLLATAVIVTVAMFETLYYVMG